MMTKLNNWQIVVCYEDLDENDGYGIGSGRGEIDGIIVAINYRDPEYPNGRTYGCGCGDGFGFTNGSPGYQHD